LRETMPALSRRACFVLSFFMLAACCLRLRAQNQSAPPIPKSSEAARNISVTVSAPSARVLVITNAPYSAEQHTIQSDAVADGSRAVSEPRIQLHYRDSAGRTRVDRQMGMPGNDYKMFFVADNVAGYTYLIDPQAQTVHRFVLHGIDSQPLRRSDFFSPRKPQPQAPEGPVISFEQLGNETIAGVTAAGRITKTTFPVGLVGNDRPIVATQEEWMSPELLIPMRTKTYDPRRGEVLVEIVKLDRSEPEPELFRVPAGYTVIDETGSFRISSGH